MGSRVAHIAIPENDGGIGLDDLKAVLAIRWGGHCDMYRVSWSQKVNDKTRLEAC